MIHTSDISRMPRASSRKKRSGKKRCSHKKGAPRACLDEYPILQAQVIARYNRINTMHLAFATWSIERKMLSTHISDASNIVTDLAEIIADYNGSAHGRALDQIHNSHGHIFASRFASVALHVDSISAGELMGNFEHMLGPLGYQSTMIAYSTYGPNRATRKLILGLLYEIIDQHNNNADGQRMTDMFYQIILLTWQDNASAI